MAPCNSVILLAAIMHLAWAMTILLTGPQEFTAAEFIMRLVPWLVARALVYLVTGGLAIWFLALRHHTFWRFAALVPQQFLLLLSAAAALLAVWHGAYADGIIHPSGFILADQCIYIVLAGLHTWGFYRANWWTS